MVGYSQHAASGLLTGTSAFQRLRICSTRCPVPAQSSQQDYCPGHPTQLTPNH